MAKDKALEPREQKELVKETWGDGIQKGRKREKQRGEWGKGRERR